MKQSFVICIRNDDYPASLEKRKLYVRLPDPEAEKNHYIRVIDESGEDYLYPEGYFAAIELSDETRQAIMTDLTAQELREKKGGACPYFP